MTSTATTAQQHLSDQREFVKTRHLENQRVAANKGGPSGLVDERILAESMRSVRYADEAHAAGDLVDNAIEAGAHNVHLSYRLDGQAIQEIAFIDDASGIDPDFLPHATKWGGSSNEGQRNTFGRFGFGLPSASVNRGRAFDVLSRTEAGSQFRSVTVDLDNLVNEDGVVQLPRVDTAELPDWVQTYAEEHFPGGAKAVRTVVVWRKLDRLAWANVKQSTSRFLEHLGITYASWLDVVGVTVNGTKVEPVDVLFTTPGFRWHDIEGHAKAEAQDPIKFTVADDDGQEHQVTVRFSLLSVDAYDAVPPPTGRGRPPKIRKKIRKNYNGIFVTRNGRFIELAKPSNITWSNYARQIGVSLDFPPALDEMFGVTPDKQTIVFTDRAEDLLESHGVVRAFKSLYKEVQDERSRLKQERDAINEDGEKGDRPSEKTVQRVVEQAARGSRPTSEEAREEAERTLKERVDEVAKATGVPKEEIEKAKRDQHRKKPYRVEFERETEDHPFYTPIMEGTQLTLRINTAHPWYRDLYGKISADAPELRSGLELMLWILALSEVDAGGPTRAFYRAERREWSRQLAAAFDIFPLVMGNARTRDEADDDDPEAWADDDESDAADDDQT